MSADKPWMLYTVAGHQLVERFAEYSHASARKVALGKAGVPCLITNKALRTAELRIVNAEYPGRK